MKNQLLSHSTKLLIFGFALATLFLTSCKKENAEEGDGYMISFSVDQSLEKFTEEDSPVGGFYTHDSQYSGLFSCTGNSKKIILEVLDNKEITESVYKGFVKIQSDMIGAVITYHDGPTTYRSSMENSDVDVRIEITKITATTVRGKFRGTLQSTGKADIVITDGEFFVPLGNSPT